MSTATRPTDPSTQPEPSRRGRRRLLLAGTGVLAVLVVLLVLWVTGSALAAGRTPAGTTVLGVDIGRMTPAQAEQRLAEELGPRAAAPLPVRVADQSHEVDPAQAGLSFDAEATAENAATRPLSPVAIVRDFSGGGEVEPVVEVDEERLGAAVAALATQSARTVREGDLEVTATEVEAVEPVTGVALEVEGARAALLDGYLEGSGDTPATVELPARTTPPRIGPEEVERARTEVAEPALSAPVVLDAAGTRVEVPVEVLASALSFEARDGRLEPALDGAALDEALGQRLQTIEEPARDASFRVEAGRPVVVPSVPGRAFAPADLAAAVLPVLTAAGEDRVAVVEPAVQEAELTTAEAEALGVTEQLSTVTQSFPYAAYRVQNIGTAAERIDGTLLLPGETFSMNETIGERTPQNGYTEGTVIVGGRFREAQGGGVSTITTAVWDAAFHAGLERVEQRAHSLWISHYKPGLEATVSWGALDLKFRNDSPHAVYVTAHSGRDDVTITMWGTKRYDVEAVFGPRTNPRPPETVYDPSPECVPMSGVPGFHIVVTRVFRQDGEVVRREPLKTVYNATNEVHCRQEPSRRSELTEDEALS